jgi:phosphoribosylformimino-5-aminoimidazole carboxamide ribotide isomerase
MDLMSGIVVAAERGKREMYRPVGEKSLLVSTSDPLTVVEEVKPRFLYVADLDRIMGRGDNLGVVSSLFSKVELLIADLGFRKISEVYQIASSFGSGKFKPVIPTETFDLRTLIRSEERIGSYYISLDIADGILDASGSFKTWGDVVEFVNSLSPDGLILLTLRNVGSLKPRFDLLEKVIDKSDHPVLLGGGIGSLEDLEYAKDVGCSGVLVSTALHRKLIPLELVRNGEL